MPRAEYTNDELWILDALERTAWIEVARRKAQQVQPDAVRALIDLRNEMQTSFESQGLLWDDEARHGADLVFDAVQFGKDPSAAHESQLQVLSEALEYYGERVHQAGMNASYAEGFKWSDFSTLVDLRRLHSWWIYLNRSDTRKDLGTEHGRFSSIGAPRLEPDRTDISNSAGVFAIKALQFPTRVPMRVHRDGLEVISTEQFYIRVNDYMLANKIVLLVDLDKPIPSMRRVEEAIYSVHQQVRAVRNYEQLEQGIVPDDLLRESKDLENNPMLRHLISPQEHQIVTAYNSVEPLLRGLCAFDLVASGMADAAACKAVAHDLACGQQVVTYALKDVRRRVDRYEPSELPW